MPFLQIRLNYALNGPNKLNKSTNQRRRRPVRRRSGRSHSATAEGEGKALRRLEGGPPAPIDLSITRTLSLFLAMPRHHSDALAISRYPSVPLALSHYYSINHALFRSLSLTPAPTHYFWPSHGPSHSFPLFLAIYGHHTVPLALPHHYSVDHAFFRSLSLTITRFLTLILAIPGDYKVPLTPYRSF